MGRDFYKGFGMSENKLTSTERSDLRRLEKIVDDGLHTFIDVGNALREIRDSKLYREKWTTFEGYVEDRYDMKRAHAYRLIEAVETKDRVEKMSPIGRQITNERQLRELANVPESAIQTVLDKVVEKSQETGEPITARSIKAAAESVVSQSESEPEEPEPEPTKDDLGKTIRLERAKFKKTQEAMMRLVDDLNKLRKSGQHKALIENLRQSILMIDKW